MGLVHYPSGSRNGRPGALISASIHALSIASGSDDSKIPRSGIIGIPAFSMQSHIRGMLKAKLIYRIFSGP
ncbi:MAG: hypothetical protein V3V33_03585 [Candidatus Lokiarchaeia archaeon]